MDTDLDDEDLRNEDKLYLVGVVPDDVTKADELIAATHDLFKKGSPVGDWHKTIVRMVAPYFTKRKNRDTFDATIDDIASSLQEIHAEQKYPEQLTYLKEQQTVKHGIKELEMVRICPTSCQNLIIC